jgi:hypothetical protein
MKEALKDCYEEGSDCITQIQDEATVRNGLSDLIWYYSPQMGTNDTLRKATLDIMM